MLRVLGLQRVCRTSSCVALSHVIFPPGGGSTRLRRHHPFVWHSPSNSASPTVTRSSGFVCRSSFPPPCSLTSPSPPPPSFLGALLSWTTASAVLVTGFVLELPLLFTWRLLHTLTNHSPPVLSFLFARPALVLLTVAYHLRIRYCYLLLSCFGVRLTVINRNAEPFLVHTRPYLFVQCNQTSLLEPVCFQAASYAALRARLSAGARWQSPFTLSTPHFFVNWQYGSWPLLGWVQGLTATWVVRTWPSQARGALDRMIRRMRPASPSVPPDSFYISPEGYRSTDGVLGAYKTGAAVAAIGAGAIVVPVVMKGAQQAMGWGEWRVREVGITVVYAETIDPQGMGYDDRGRLTAAIRERYEDVVREQEEEAKKERERVSAVSNAAG